MNKILNFFCSLSIPIKYVGSRTLEHIGGKSFYNDGYYTIDIYQFELDGIKYEIRHKSTGRPQFWLYKNNKYITIRFNQRDMVALINEILEGKSENR